MSVLNNPVLILNNGWTAIRVKNVVSAIKLACRERASIVDTDTYSLYFWEDWAKLEVKPGDIYIQSVNSRVRVPEVVVLTKYHKVPDFDIRLTKRALYLRDRGQCQYTGRRLGKTDYDVDHIVPKSRGGKNTWSNMVLCDKKVNRQKADRTPQEAGLNLIRKPFKPKTSTVMFDPNIKKPESWIKFLK